MYTFCILYILIIDRTKCISALHMKWQSTSIYPTSKAIDKNSMHVYQLVANENKKIDFEKQDLSKSSKTLMTFFNTKINLSILYQYLKKSVNFDCFFSFYAILHVIYSMHASFCKLFSSFLCPVEKHLRIFKLTTVFANEGRMSLDLYYLYLHQYHSHFHIMKSNQKQSNYLCAR